MTRIAIDWECHGQKFWDHVRSLHPLDIPVRLRVILRGNSGIDSTEIFESDWAWLSRQPGWNDGPAHARTPLIIQIRSLDDRIDSILDGVQVLTLERLSNGAINATITFDGSSRDVSSATASTVELAIINAQNRGARRP